MSNRIRRGMLAGATALAVLLGGLGPAAIAQQSPAPDPARIAAAKELFVAMGTDAQFRTVIDTMTNGLAGVYKQRQPDKGKELDEVFAALRAPFHARSAEVVEMVAPLLAQKLSKEELDEIAAFFKSTVGRKLVAVQPEIMRRSMQLGMAWGQRIAGEVDAEARRELKKRGIAL